MTGHTRKNVLILDCSPFTGGAQRSIVEMVPGLIDQGWAPRVVAADHTPGGVLDSCRKAGIPVCELTTRHWRRTLGGGLRFVVDRVLAGRTIRRAVQEWRPEVIYANGIRAGLLIPGAICRSIPVCLHDRDLRVPQWAVRRMTRRARCVVAISECVAAKWASTTVDVRVIPNGFDLDAWRRAADTPLSNAVKGTPVLILVADLMPWKRHTVFLDALAETRRRAPDTSGLVVGRCRDEAGRGYLAALRQHAAAAGLADAVRFVTDAASVAPWIAAADILVSVADQEPFGRTVVEALALGKPVVAVDACGPGEVLAACPAATLSGPMAHDVAVGIGCWLDPQERHQADHAARDWAERYRLDLLAEAMAETFSHLGETDA